jgi:hypothetical protein
MLRLPLERLRGWSNGSGAVFAGFTSNLIIGGFMRHRNRLQDETLESESSELAGGESAAVESCCRRNSRTGLATQAGGAISAPI